MAGTFLFLGVLLVTGCLTAALPEEIGDPPVPEEEVDEVEATPRARLDLEDPASWSASTEVLDENHAWYRRRRAVDNVDLEVSESVVFQPKFLRVQKRAAHEECRVRNDEFILWRRHARHVHHDRHAGRTVCNSYCCYPVIPHDLE